MRTRHVLSYRIGVMLFMFLALSEDAGASRLYEQLSYVVLPSCVSPTTGKPTEEGTFYYRLRLSAMVDSEAHMEIVVDGQPLTQFHVNADELPYTRDVGPFAHSGVGGSFHEYILRSLDDGTADTLYVAEVVCGFSTSNGLNRAGYYCRAEGGGVIAQTKPEEILKPKFPDKTYVYVLINVSTNLVEDKNFSGHFQGIVDLELYEIHAFATTFEQSAEFINGIEIGFPFDISDVSFCYALCGVYEVEVDCSSFDLSVEKRVQGGIVYEFGDTVVFDIVINNEGSITAYNIVVKDEIPNGLIFPSAMNALWNADGTSKLIDSIEAGHSIVIPITMIVDQQGTFVEVVNSIELIGATASADQSIPAFDVDSSPGNNQLTEDDSDEETIIILENLCQQTFLIDVGHDPVCIDKPMVLYPTVLRSNGALRYYWRYGGTLISRDSILVIEGHTASQYGQYDLTVVDAMGCTGTVSTVVAPIDNTDLFSCFTDVYVGVNDDCQIDLRPDMFTNRMVSAINDYELEIRDASNQPVDIGDLWQYDDNTVLEVRIVNPCNGQTVCGSNLHLQRDVSPELDLYASEYAMPCVGTPDLDPQGLISYYNDTYGKSILSSSEFQDSLNAQSCIQEWQVSTSDFFSGSIDMCTSTQVYRIYYIIDQEIRLPLDTAILRIEPLRLDYIVGIEDVDNISCDAGYDPLSIGSAPIYVNGIDSFSLINAVELSSSSFCNLGITYRDEYLGGSCIYGVNKIMRKWAITDWCSNEIWRKNQFLYIVDKDAPTWEMSDSITVEVAPYACHANLRFSDYAVVVDNCDSDIKVYGRIDGADLSEAILSIGVHSITLYAEDHCGNRSAKNVIFRVIEYTPPAVVLNAEIVIGVTEDLVLEANFITAQQIDAGSHDYECGSIQIDIAREAEVSVVASAGGSIELSTNLYNCEGIPADWDRNDNGYLTIDELFRNKVVFCCQDIGKTVEIAVRVMDESGNVAFGTMQVQVQADRDYTPCDDGDPCTIDDRSYGDCPCQGTPMLRDEDGDGIMDCEDEHIVFCLNDVSIEVAFEHIDSIIMIGGVGGGCPENADMADIGGSVRTPNGQMISDVEVLINNDRSVYTDEVGVYVFHENPQYERYELLPVKDDDPLNGVTVKDLVLLKEYLLGLRSITDPYQMIAADVNDDGSITALDLVELKMLLIGNVDRYPSNNSWRFKLESFEWDDIRDPWNYQEIDVIDFLDRDMMYENWIGIKIGDLSGDVTSSQEQAVTRRDKSIHIVVRDQSVKAGDVLSIAFSVEDRYKLRALQLGVQLEGIIVRGIRSGSMDIKPGEMAIRDARFDGFSIVWDPEMPMEVGKELWILDIEVVQGGRLSEMIALDHSRTPAYVYFDDLIEGEITLNFVEDGSMPGAPLAKSIMYQNQPNPFTGKTLIQFELPEPGAVTFRFYTVGGKEIYHLSGDYGRGVNAIHISNDLLKGYSGIIYYQMVYGQERHTRAMIAGQY